MSEIILYAIRTETVRKLDLRSLQTAMPKRAAAAWRFRFEKDRLLCLGAGFLMMKAVGIRDESELRQNEYGKPFAEGVSPFNLSHSGEWCVLAVGAPRTVGVDIEEINPSHIDLAPRVYTSAERDWMAADPVNRFFQLWTWKESVMKATGLGMNLEPQTFEVLPFTEGLPIHLLGKSWYALGGSLDGYQYSVCSDDPVETIRWLEVAGSER